MDSIVRREGKGCFTTTIELSVLIYASKALNRAAKLGMCRSFDDLPKDGNKFSPFSYPLNAPELKKT